MSIITKYVSRTLDQEPDAAVLIPGHPDYVVIATYTLLKANGNTTDSNEPGHQLRGGSLLIIPYNVAGDTGQEVVPLARKDLGLAILDIHFHPEDGTLLAAATSGAQVRFFRVLHDASISGEPSFSITEITSATMADDPQTISMTYFNWLPGVHTSNDPETGELETVMLAVCDTRGSTRIARFRLPGLDEPAANSAEYFDSDTYEEAHIHQQKHGLEAWFVTNITLPPQVNGGKPTSLFLSGGDDSCLVASIRETCVEDSLDTTEAVASFTIKDQHTAGVVSILPLDEVEPDFIPLLTGSYDDHLRLFMLRPSLLPKVPDLVTSIDLGGGVWRIILLDHYYTPDKVGHWTLLICAMYDGAKIVRLTATSKHSSPETSDGKAGLVWEFKVEAEFKAGHQSMVYAALARKAERDTLWDIMTTSFYDRKVCNWQWEDKIKGT